MKTSISHQEHLAEVHPTLRGNPRLVAALDYGRRNWSVLPVWWREDGRCACGKADCAHPAKHPLWHPEDLPNGRNSATTDQDIINRWWGRWPMANVAIATGQESGLIVLDIDPRNGGNVANLPGILPVTPTVMTGGGGEHYLLAHPGNSYVKGESALGGHEGIDLKADGGYIVAPPSQHVSGNDYTWKITPDSILLAPIPQWLTETIKRNDDTQRKASGLKGEQIPLARRNKTLTSLAGSMRRRGMTDEEIFIALLAVNQRCVPPLSETEVRRIAASVGRYEPGAPDWPEPRALPEPQPLIAPSLPGVLLPPPLAPWLQDIAERMCVPLEMVAAPAIVVLSTVVGRAIGICPKEQDDWIVVPNLWGGIVARPGLLKTPILNAVMGPLRRLIDQARQDYQLRLSDAEVGEEIIRTRMKEIQKRMEKAARKEENLDSFGEELKNLKQELQNIRVAERRYITHDPTVEKLGELLRDNPRGLLLIRDELAGWLWTLERPGREGEREFYLESWDGTASFTFDRIGRGTVNIPFLTLSIFGGIQPSKLRSYFAGALTEKGHGADGLLQRFQILVWPDSVPEWKNKDRVPDTEAQDRAFAIVERLANLDHLKIGAEILKNNDIPALRFAPDAQDFFNEWRDRLERRLRSSEMEHQPAFESHLAKYRSLMPSLSLIFQLTEVTSGRVTNAVRVGLHNAELAAAWCDFLEAHALKVYDLEGQASPANTLGDHILEGKVRDNVSCREVYRRGWAHLDTPERVQRAAQILEEHQWIRVEEQSPSEKGGRPSFRLRINPKLRITNG